MITEQLVIGIYTSTKYAPFRMYYNITDYFYHGIRKDYSGLNFKVISLKQNSLDEDNGFISPELSELVGKPVVFMRRFSSDRNTRPYGEFESEYLLLVDDSYNVILKENKIPDTYCSLSKTLSVIDYLLSTESDNKILARELTQLKENIITQYS